jgi:transaldolase
LVAKNPEIKERLGKGEKLSEQELLGLYRDIVTEISELIPAGSVSVEVYADASTKADEMLRQGRRMFSWIPNAHVKLPSTEEGLEAAQRAVREGLRVNMTLCFSQKQAAAAAAATAGARQGDVFVSPFVGRFDDKRVNGMDLVANIIAMYRGGDRHVEVLAASVRSVDHLLCAFRLGADIVTAPFEVLKEWAQKGMPLPTERYEYKAAKGLKPIPYEEIPAAVDWRALDLRHDLTAKGEEKFSADWNALIERRHAHQ